MPDPGRLPALSSLRHRYGAVHDNHKRIAAGALLIGALLVIAKLFALGREVAIAWRFGLSPVADAYQIAFTIVSWLPMMLAGVMVVVLVPRLVALRRKSGDYHSFIAELNGATLLAGLAIALLTFVVAPYAAALLSGPLDPLATRLTGTMAVSMAPVAFLIVAAGYLAARLQARERFAYSAMEAVPALSIAAMLIIVTSGDGVEALVIGTLGGFALQFLAMWLLVRSSDPPAGRLDFRFRSPEWQSLFPAIAAMALAQLMITAVLPIDQLFASRIGDGVVATLGYANRIITLITGFGIAVLSRALLPVLSGAIANDEHDLGRRQVMQWATLMFAASVAGAVIGWILAPWGVSLLFERGAFDQAASDAVTTALRFGLVQVPPFFAGIALVQWYAASGRFNAILGFNLVALAVKVALNLVLAPVLGIAGIMLATAGMYMATTLFMAWGLGKGRAIGRDSHAPEHRS